MSDRIKKLEEVNNDVYSSLSLEKLIIYALDTLIENDEPTALDDVSVRAFNLFPDKFSMKHYRHPDIMRVGRELWRLKNKEKVRGSETKKQYLITEKGEEILQEVKEKFNDKRETDHIGDGKKNKADKRKYSGKWVNYIEANELYKEYKKNNLDDKIPSHRFKNLLVLPMSASRSKVENNLKDAIKACEEENREDLIKFLKECKKKVSW